MQDPPSDVQLPLLSLLTHLELEPASGLRSEPCSGDDGAQRSVASERVRASVVCSG